MGLFQRQIVVCILLSVGCGVERATFVDVFEMDLNGERFEADIQEYEDGSSSYAFAFDDATGGEKRYDPNVELFAHARDKGGVRFYFNTRRAFGAGRQSMGRAWLPRVTEPWMAITFEEGGVTRDFRPASHSVVDIIDPGAGTNLIVRFERVNMLDECNRPLVLTDGYIDLPLTMTNFLPPMPKLEDWDFDPAQIEGGAHFVIDQTPLYAYAPSYEFYTNSGGDWFHSIMVDWCSGFSETVAIIAPAQIQAGMANVSDFTLIHFVDVTGTLEDPSDDKMWFGVDGVMEILPFDGDGLLSGQVVEEIRLCRGIYSGGSIQLDCDDTQQMTEGAFDLYLGGVY